MQTADDMSQTLDSLEWARAIALFSMLLGCGAEADSGGGGNVGLGGAQDIGQFRDILERGEIPAAATLDAGGFFAEHHVEPTPATCGESLCPEAMLAEGRDWLTGDHQSVLQLGLTTPIDPATLPRRPLDLALVVDVSGSMLDDDRLTYVKQGLRLLADEIAAGDRVALVAYSDAARVVLPLAELARDAFLAEVDALAAGGATNLHGGLELGFELVAATTPGREARVILLSDGLATAGQTDAGAILELAVGQVSDGAGLTTIGVGDEFDVELMRGLAERGGGSFYYLESAVAVDEVFRQELATSLQPIGLDVRLAIDDGPTFWTGAAVGTRLWRPGDDGGAVELPAVFVASRTDEEPGEGRRGGGGAIFVELERADDDDGVIDVALAYRAPGEGEARAVEVTLDAPPRDDEAPHYSHPAMAERMAIYNIYRGLHQVTSEAEWSHDCALVKVERLRRAVEGWNAEADDPDVAADLELIARLAENLRAAGARGDVDDGSCEDPMVDSYVGCTAGGPGGALGIATVLLLAWRAGRSKRKRREHGFAVG